MKRKWGRRWRWVIGTVGTLAAIGAGTLVYLDEQHSFDIRTESFEFESGGNELVATLHLPLDDGPHGVIAFVPGDGPADNGEGIFPVWEVLARAGYATVSWDKPGVGGSSGNWLDQDMSDRAGEVVDVVDLLADRDDLDTDDLGVIGVSQGGWVVPLVAERIEIDFYIAWSTAINWLEQGAYLTERELEAADASPELRERVRAADLAGDDAVADSFERYVAWRESLDADVAQFFGQMQEDRWRFAMRNKDLDARDSLPALQGTPVLLLLGGRDDNVDVADTERVYRQLLDGPCLEVLHYPDGEHNLLDHDGIGLTLAGTFQPRSIFAEGMLDDVQLFAEGPRTC